MHFSTKLFSIYFYWITFNKSYLSTALKDVHITIPRAVRSGDNVLLSCDYDLEKENLYSVKWYKGRREFYRYMPNDQRPITVFHLTALGVKVETSMSNASSVLLTAVEPSSSGRYSCEVSADAPTFHTEVVTAALEVVDLPKTGPSISTPERIYRIGDILAANCTIIATTPLVQLTWLINNNTAHPQQINSIIAFKDDFSQGHIMLGLQLVLQPKHFRNPTLMLACRANIYDIYEQTTIQVIALDATSNQILAGDYNTFGTSSHQKMYYEDVEEYDSEDVLGNDVRMNHIKDPHISAKSSSSQHQNKSIKLVLLLLLIPTLTCAILDLLLSKSSENKDTEKNLLFGKIHCVQSACRTFAGFNQTMMAHS